jgi:hypothetical protein
VSISTPSTIHACVRVVKQNSLDTTDIHPSRQPTRATHDDARRGVDACDDACDDAIVGVAHRAPPQRRAHVLVGVGVGVDPERVVVASWDAFSSPRRHHRVDADVDAAFTTTDDDDDE